VFGLVLFCVNSDQLMSYGDEAFVYDDYIGNPTTYRGKSASWTHGRELTSYNGTTFTYDARGRREKKKKQNETAITFTYDSNGNLIKQNNGLEFFYDHTGVFAFKYNNFTYFYRKNAQNDVIAILDNTGDTVVKYVYDAWGNHKILDASGVEITDDTHIGVLNPFRYRSYYFDTETDLYFLKTRYYDPEIGRFITIDDISYLDPETINGLNLYAYCGNNPVNRVDYTGTIAITTILISIAIGALIGGVISGGFAIGSQIHENGWSPTSWDWKEIGLSTLGGVFAGAISAIPLGGWGGALAFGALGSLVGGLISGSVDSLESAIIAMSIGAIANVAAYGISNKITNVQAGKIFNQSNKAKSLAVQKLQSHPLNMGSKVLKGRYRNAFKNTTEKEIKELITNAYSLLRYGVYSSITSSALSGWY